MQQIRSLLSVRSRGRRVRRSARRLAWQLGVPHTNPKSGYRGPALTRPLVAVLGMHRSGTSAVVGMVEDQGFSAGIGRVGREADNPFGTRENHDLVRLNKAVLHLNGHDWDRPPTGAGLRFTVGELRRRDRFVASLGGTPAVLKDPRMVLLEEYWRGVPLLPIGVIRNPIAVSDSLRRREPHRSVDECLRMWLVYNTHLLRWCEARPFPVIEFGGAGSLERDVELALAQYGLPAPNKFRFFDADLIRSEEQGMKWREQVPPTLPALWDRILRCSNASYSRMAGKQTRDE